MPTPNAPLQSVPKHAATDPVSGWIHFAAVGMGVLFLGLLTGWMIISGRPASLELHFNAFAILSIASLISNLVAFVLVVRIKERTDVLLWFSVFLLSLAAWAAAETMLRLSATPAAATFWSPFTTLGSVFMPISLYMFALAYTNTKRTLNPFVFPILVGTSALFVFIDAHTQLLTIYTPSSMVASPWGFVVGTGPAYLTISAWLMLLAFASLVLLVRFRRTTIEPTLRSQTKLFIIAIAIPLVGGGITDGIMPAFDEVLVPPMSVALLTIMGIVISYGIHKYHFFSFTPGLIASEILGTMNEAVIGITPDFRLSYANAGTERLLDLTSEDLATKHLYDLLAQKLTPSQLQERIFDHLAGQDSYALDSVDFCTSAGRTITTKLAITKVTDKGQSYGYLLVLTDITAITQTKALIEQKVIERTQELHEEQAKLRASIEGLTLGFALVDLNNKIVVQNKALATIFDLFEPASSIEQLQKHITNIDLAAESQHVQTKDQMSKLQDVSFGSKVLRIFMGPVEAVKADKKQVIGTVLSIEDITEATVQARSKDEFFSIASHELRTPLTAIRGNAGMLLDMYKEVLDREGMGEMVQDIRLSSMRLIDIVNDFLDVSRIEQGKIAFAYVEVELDKIIEAVIYEMRAVLQEKHLSLDFNKKTLGQLPKVWADKDRLKQIIYNLVGNAAKFTDKGGINIDATAEGDVVKISVIDTGRGISLDNQRLLFHKFQQAGGSLLTRDTTRGTGLGLYISKMLIENMGGHIYLESSTESQGSTFAVTIPISTGKQAAANKIAGEKTDSKTGLTQVETVSLAANALAKPAVAKSDGKPGRLLIIEDDPYVLRMYSRIFDAELLTIKTALNGSLGYAAAQSFHPDLILLDVMMPVMNGIEALDALKGNPITNQIPVIMLSSLGEEDIVRQALDKGAVAYLIKSDFAPEQLQQEIQKHLKER